MFCNYNKSFNIFLKFLQFLQYLFFNYKWMFILINNEDLQNCLYNTLKLHFDILSIEKNETQAVQGKSCWKTTTI